MVVDVGCGDGRFVVRTATREPRTLAIGLDASVAALGRGFSRASRARLPNAHFVLAAAEQLPHELTGIASEVRVQFPWGSLLRSLVTAEPALVASLAAMLVPDGRLVTALSLIERDRLADVPVVTTKDDAHSLLRRLEATGCFAGGIASEITSADLRDLASPWANRIGVARTRPGWRLETARRS